MKSKNQVQRSSAYCQACTWKCTRKGDGATPAARRHHQKTDHPVDVYRVVWSCYFSLEQEPTP